MNIRKITIGATASILTLLIGGGIIFTLLEDKPNNEPTVTTTSDNQTATSSEVEQIAKEQEKKITNEEIKTLATNLFNNLYNLTPVSQDVKTAREEVKKYTTSSLAKMLITRITDEKLKSSFIDGGSPTQLLELSILPQTNDATGKTGALVAVKAKATSGILLNKEKQTIVKAGETFYTLYTIEANYQKKASDIRYLGSIQEKDYNKVKELSNQSQEVDYTKSNRVMTSVIDTFSTLSKTNELKESQLAVENNKNNLEDEPFNFLFGWTKDFNVEEYSMNGAFTEELQLNKDLEIFGRGANNGKIETLNYFSVFRTRDIDSNNSQQTAELVYLYDVIFNPATEKIEMLVSIGLDVNNNSGLQVEGLTDFNAQ